MINGRRWELCGRDRGHAAPASHCQSLGMRLVRPNGSSIPLQRWHLKPLPCYPAVGTAGPPYPQPPPGTQPSTPLLPLPDTSQQITIKRQSFSSNKCSIIYNESAGRAHGGRYELVALNGARSFSFFSFFPFLQYLHVFYIDYMVMTQLFALNDLASVF